MRRLALLLVLVAAGCGGSKPAAEFAYLKDVRVEPGHVVFEFESAPRDVRAHFRPPSEIAESGSGAPVRLEGNAALVVTFTPAATATIDGEEVVPTYTGPRRIRAAGGGPVNEAVKVGDFEAQLDWAIGLTARMPYRVKRDGGRVTVSFG
jgi:hypothetical protein